MHKGNKPQDGANKPRTNRVTLILSDDELAALDEWTYRTRQPSRNDAIRALITAGMITEKAG